MGIREKIKKMTDNYYFTDPNVTGYKKSAPVELKEILEKIDFKYKEPDGLGGGGGEVIQQIIAHLSVHDIVVGVVSGLFVSRIEKILSALSAWHNANKNPNNHLRPVVNIYIYSPKDEFNHHNISFRLDKKYSKSEIKKELKK